MNKWRAMRPAATPPTTSTIAAFPPNVVPTGVIWATTAGCASPPRVGGITWLGSTLNAQLLVIVDLQNGLYGTPDSWPEQLRKYNPEIADAWNKRMKDIVLPNVNRLTEFCRKHDILIVWITLNPAEILPQLKTRFGSREIHVVKQSAGAFTTSALDGVLREFDIKTLLMVGADTPCCFMATVDGAYDRNYQTIVVEDGCQGSRPELHEAAIKIWAYPAFVRSTDQVIDDYPWKKWLDPSIRDKE